MANPKLENEIRELKTTLIEDAKERANLEAQKKTLSAENVELKQQLSQLRTEYSATKLSLQSKINELSAKCESQAKEISLLEVSDRKNKKYIAEIQKQVADLGDIKKRQQIQQTENAAKMDTEIKEKTSMQNDLRRLKDEVKDLKLKIENESNARVKAEMELDNATRRLSSQEGDFKNKHLAILKEVTTLAEMKKKYESQTAQFQKRISEVEMINKGLSIKLKEAEKKLLGGVSSKITNISKASGFADLSAPLTPLSGRISSTSNGNAAPNVVPPISNGRGKKKNSGDKKKSSSDPDEPEEDDENAELAAEQFILSNNSSSFLQLPPEYADILVIGKEKIIEKILVFLNSKKHKASNCDLEEVIDALTKKRYQIVVCPARMLPEMLSLNTSFLEVFKRNNTGVPFLTFSLSEGIENVVKQLNNQGELTPTCELVKAQLTVYMQTIWANDQMKSMSENLEKDKEMYLVSRSNQAVSKLEEELRQLDSLKRKADKENMELKSVVSKLVDEKGKREVEVDQLKKKVSALCSKIFLLELESQATSALPQNLPTDKQLVEMKEQSEKTVSQVVGSFSTPMQTLTRLIILLLKDDRTKELRPYLEAILNSLSSSNYHNIDFNEFFQEAGIDTLTQSWMLYEFTRGKLVSKSSGRPRMIVPESDELKLPEVRDKDIIVENWACDPHIYTQDELFTLYIQMLDKLGLIEYFDIPRTNLINFIKTLAKNYRKNPYHNFQHAFDVSQMCFRMVYKTKAMDYLTEMDLLALLLAAICHDVDHPGLNNNFQINDNTHLALLYNDLSVLENHHASRSFYLINTAEYNIFANFEESTYREIRKRVVNAILATDMANHFELMSKFTTHLNMQPFSNKNPESRQLLVNVLLHVADIANVARPWDIAKRWSDQVLEEFLHQGDLEKDKDLLISPYMDRNNTDQPKMSLGFIDYMVLPMFTTLKKVVPEVNEAVETIHKNRAIWAERAEHEVNVDQVMDDFRKQSNSSDSDGTSADSTPRSDESSQFSNLPDSGKLMRRGSSPAGTTTAKKGKSASAKVSPLKTEVEFAPELLKIKKDNRKKKTNLPNISTK